MKLLFKDGCRHIYITGFGTVARNTMVELAKYPDMELVRQYIGHQWEEVETHLISPMMQVPVHHSQKWDVTLNLCPPEHLSLPGGLNVAMTQNGFSEILPDWVEKLKGPELLLVPSEYDQEVFKKYDLPAEILPQASDPEFFKPGPKTDGKFRVLNVATFNFRKGQDLILRAWKDFAGAGDKSVELVFKTGRQQGGKELLMKLMYRYKMQNYQNITIDSKVSSPMDMVKLYNNSSVLVTASRGEGWNMPNTEAMCCELPVVSAFSTGMKMYLTDQNSYPLKAKPIQLQHHERTYWSDGWLKKYGVLPTAELYDIEPADLAQTLKHIKANYSEAQEKAKQARKDIQAQFTWPIVTKQLHDYLVKFGESHIKVEEDKRCLPDREYK